MPGVVGREGHAPVLTGIGRVLGEEHDSADVGGVRRKRIDLDVDADDLVRPILKRVLAPVDVGVHLLIGAGERHHDLEGAGRIADGAVSGKGWGLNTSIEIAAG